MSSSRPWKVTVREPLRETVVAKDEVRTSLEIPPILAPEQTAQVLGRILKEHGFDDEGGKMVREDGGVRVEVDPGTGGVSVSASESADVPPEEPKGGCPCAARLRERAAKAAAADVEKGLQARVTGRLERALGPLGCELEKVANQVTAKALIERAKQVGELKRIVHDDATGEVTVVVEV